MVSLVSAEMKIGYINSDRIFKEYEATKDAYAKFNKEVEKWEQQASEMQKKIMELKEQLEKQSLLLSSERKQELEAQLKEEYMAYQKFIEEKLGQNGEVMKKNAELSKPIVEKIQGILDKIGKEEHYDFIFDAQNGGLVFAKQGYDLTEKVLAVLNSEKEK